MLQGKREVIKHSAAIHIQNNITLLQRRAWNVLLANAYDELPVQEHHRIRIQDLMRALEFDSKNDEYLKEALEALVSCKVKWNILDKDGEHEWGVTTLLAEAKIKTGVCTYAYGPTLRDRLHNPRMYARISLSMQNKFESKHAQALWEVCTDYLDEVRNQGETPFIGLREFKGLMGIGTDGYGGEFKIINRDVIKPSVKEINTVTDFDVKAEYKREKRKVAAVKFRVRRVEQFPGQRPRQGELFFDNKDTPLSVRELKNAGLAAEEAWKIWQEGFKYVEESRRPPNIGDNPEEAFDQYVLEKVHLLKRWQAEQKVRNITGFLREALRKNYANPEFVAEQKTRKIGEQTKAKRATGSERERVEAQKAVLKKARDADMHQLCETIVQEAPAILEEAAEQIFRVNPLIRKVCPLEKTLLESYREKPMLRVLVDQYLMKLNPERFLTVRERYEAQLTAIEEETLARKHTQA
jgi:Initiator Replication protein, WH1/Initiator Rep protein, WH2